MTTTQRILATLTFLITLGGTACDRTERETPQAEAAPAAREEVGPLAQADELGAGCCGRFMDGDGDSTCDLAANGECRRGRDGRCACAGGCSGCL